MEVKEYEFYKTVRKTAKENNLVIADRRNTNFKYLFDFSLLENLDISDEEKEYIKQDALNNVTIVNRKNHFYINIFNSFFACEGVVTYHKNRVYSKNGSKYCYDVMQLSSIEHFSKNRKSIYDDFNVTKVSAYDGYSQRLEDIEIA